MAACLGGCGEDVGEGQKCHACAVAAVGAWRATLGNEHRIKARDESAEARRARIGRMSDAEYREEFDSVHNGAD